VPNTALPPQPRPANLKLAEVVRDIVQPLIVEMLIMEHPYGVAIDRPLDLVDHRAIKGSAEFDAVDFGATQ
jgi:hypothetical protein